jgi:hypothetical protein
MEWSGIFGYHAEIIKISQIRLQTGLCHSTETNPFYFSDRKWYGHTFVSDGDHGAETHVPVWDLQMLKGDTSF